MADTARVRWGILSTGRIARTFAQHLHESRTGVLAAVASRTVEAAEAFAASVGAGRSHGSYEALLEDRDVEAVYIATPHPMHAKWAIRAAQAGKHVLCEKPLCMNHAQAEAVVEAARANDVFLMEAFMYRCHPQTARLVGLLQDGRIGQVRLIEATHSFRGSGDPSGRLLDPALGGGGILDVGCYTMSGARLAAGSEPDRVTGTAHIGPTGVDEWAVASVSFPNGVLATLACGVALNMPPVLRIHGTEGSLTLRDPWLPTLRGDRTTEIEVRGPDGRISERIAVDADRGLYAYQADVLAEAVSSGRRQAGDPAPDWEDSLANARALDRWRAAIGLAYDADTEAGLTAPANGRPLRIRDERLPAGTVAGLEKPVSRVVLGSMVAERPSMLPTAVAVFDAYVEAGGNAFDTGYVYGQGYTDQALGFWLESRGVRDQVVLIAKGAHTPHCDPENLSAQLRESLERLRTDYADIYLMHRDNLEVPVSDFVDVLNEHHAAGRIGAFGGSNWTSERVDEANAYATSKGLVGFTVVSNQFSLARMITPTYPGTLTANTPEFREWLARTSTPNIAWSSQSAGFFAGLPPDGFLGFAWHEEENLERRRRAEALAAEKGVEPTTIALAWVLAQDLPIHPIIGPRSLAELRTSLDAVRLGLTSEEAAWLDLIA